METIKDTCIRYGPYIGGGILALGTSIYILKWIRKPKKSQHYGIDRNGVWRFPEDNRRQGNVERHCCNVVYGASTTVKVKGLRDERYGFRLERLHSANIKLCGVDYPRDKVIVHQIAKGTYAPSLGHFVVKLETYLRIAKIPYEPCYDRDMSGGPKHKIPWIEYNDFVMGDSQLIINYLNKEFNVDLNKHLTPKERATAWAVQKWLEEFTYWLNVYTRWYIRLDDMFNIYTHKMPHWVKYYFRDRATKTYYTIGVGRHSNEEVEEMMKHDIRMLSELLGDKKFFMGDQPTELDCAAFGQLAQIRWHTPDSCPGKTLMKDKLTNLMDFCERIKTLYWPDWDERVTGSPQ